MPEQSAEPAWRARVRGSAVGNLVVIGVTALAVAIGAWLVMRPDPADSVSAVEVTGAAVAPRVGQQAPEFRATSLAGDEFSLTELRGRPVWLVFMATWCAGCRAETPDVQAAHEAAGDSIAVVAIYVGENTAAVSPYAERLGLTFTQLPDPRTTISAAYGVLGVPAHFFIDAAGVVQQTQVGVLSPSQIDAAIAKVSKP